LPDLIGVKGQIAHCATVADPLTAAAADWPFRIDRLIRAFGG
jgi:hypothetical protein